MERREFIKFFTIVSLGSTIFFPNDIFAKKIKKKSNKIKKKVPNKVEIRTNETVFAEIINKAEKNNWRKLSIGDLTANIGKHFLGYPYESGTLEVNGENEEIVVNLTEFDCVTFMETSVALARIIKKEKLTLDDFVKELTLIRYRNGKISDYTSRLHYTSDWITDNSKKGIIMDVSQSFGGKPISFNVYYMSENSEQYPVLRKVPKMIGEIEVYEEHIRKRTYYYIPNDNIYQIQNKLQNGDIFAIVTNKPGLDYSHVGLITVENGSVSLLHASSKNKKVVLESNILKYFSENPNNLGVSILRPQEILN